MKNNQITLSVKGMMCPRCVAHVQKALEGVDGVIEVSVSLDEESATVMAKQSVKKETLVAAVVQEGYECN